MRKLTTEVKYHFYPIISRVGTIDMIYDVDVGFDHLAEVVVVGFSTIKLLSFPLSVLYCVEEVTRCSPHCKSGELHFSCLVLFSPDEKSMESCNRG